MESWRETLWGKVYHCGTNHWTSQIPRTSVVACKQESTCQCRGHRFDPWSRKIPHAEDQLNPCTTATGAQASWSLALQQKPLSEWPTRRDRSPCCLHPEKVCVQQQRPSTAKNKYSYYIKNKHQKKPEQVEIHNIQSLEGHTRSL